MTTKLTIKKNTSEAPAVPKGKAPTKAPAATKGKAPVKAPAATKGKAPAKAPAVPKGKAPVKAPAATKNGEPMRVKTVMNIKTINVDCIEPNPKNPRTDEIDVSDLVESFREFGIINPISVRPNGKEKFVVIAGTRRFLAAKKVGFTSIECIVRNVSESDQHDIATIENIARKQMEPADECVAVQKMLHNGKTARDVAAIFGRTPRWAIARLKMAELGKEILDLMRSGKVTLGHAEVLCSVSDKIDVLDFANMCHRLTPEQLEKEIEGSFHILSKAPFDAQTKCASCKNRTSVLTDLFDENSQDRCTQPKCYRKMVESFIDSQRKKIKRQGNKEESSSHIFKFGKGYLNAETNAEKIENLKALGVKPRFAIDPVTAKVTYCYNEKDSPESEAEKTLTEEEVLEQNQKKKFDKAREELVEKKAHELIINGLFGKDFSSPDSKAIVLIQLFSTNFYDEGENSLLGIPKNETCFLPYVFDETGAILEGAKTFLTERIKGQIYDDNVSQILSFMHLPPLDSIEVSEEEIKELMEKKETAIPTADEDEVLEDPED